MEAPRFNPGAFDGLEQGGLEGKTTESAKTESKAHHSRGETARVQGPGGLCGRASWSDPVVLRSPTSGGSLMAWERSEIFRLSHLQMHLIRRKEREVHARLFDHPGNVNVHQNQVR